MSRDILEMGPLGKDDGGKMKLKPRVKLSGEDGNIFNLVGIASRALKREGMQDSAKEMESRIFEAESYDEALAIIHEYVNAT